MGLECGYGGGGRGEGGGGRGQRGERETPRKVQPYMKYLIEDELLCCPHSVTEAQYNAFLQDGILRKHLVQCMILFNSGTVYLPEP